MSNKMKVVFNEGLCYYSVLGICRQASDAEIRGAHRKLALKWHPDRWTKDPSTAGQAKDKFQQIQEAYSVLADKGKRTIYDAGLVQPRGDADDHYDDKEFQKFMQEMVSIIEVEKSQEESSLEDLQRLLTEMMDGDETYSFKFPLRDLKLNDFHSQGATKRRRTSGL